MERRPRRGRRNGLGRRPRSATPPGSARGGTTMAKHTMTLMVLATLLAVGELRGQEPAQKPAAEPLLKVEGQLTRDDPVDPVLKKGFHKVYSVKLAVGVHYQID